MTPTIEIRRVADYVGQEVLVQGWLYNLRESGKLLFPLFRDGTGLIQGVVVKSAVSSELFERVRNLTQESSLRVTGKVRADKRAPSGFELDVTNLEIEQLIPAENPYPITLKEHGTEFLMDHRHLWLRSMRQRAILGVRHEIIKAVRDFFDGRGFTLVDTGGRYFFPTLFAWVASLAITFSTWSMQNRPATTDCSPLFSRQDP